MNSKKTSTLEAKERKLLMLRRFKSWAITLVAIVFCLVPTSTVSGYSYYSEEWMDDSDPNNPRISGSGVTYDSTNGYMGTPHGYQQIHSYWVVVTMTSPSGRTVSSTSYTSSSYVSIQVNLPLLENGEFDLGNYSVQTQHWQCCTYMAPNPWDGRRCYPNASSSIDVIVGASLTILTKAAMSNTYTKIANCNVHCPVDQLLASQNEGQYIMCVVPWTYLYGAYRCSPVSFNYKASQFDNCRDLTGRVPIPGVPF